MSEQKFNQTAEEMLPRSAVTGQPFRREVTINGLPYIFKGGLPQVRIRFDWELVIPEMDDYRAMRGQPDFFDNETSEVAYCWYGCAAGYLRIDVYQNNCDFHLTEIRSNTRFLSNRLRYHNASGVGNFLLRSFLAEADKRSALVYLTPAPDKDSRLNATHVAMWYMRNGFQYLPPAEWKPGRKMVRHPNHHGSTASLTA